jgi:hypothetical protein
LPGDAAHDPAELARAEGRAAGGVLDKRDGLPEWADDRQPGRAQGDGGRAGVEQEAARELVLLGVAVDRAAGQDVGAGERRRGEQRGGGDGGERGLARRILPT